jgi:hypothetical protein
VLGLAKAKLLFSSHKKTDCFPLRSRPLAQSPAAGFVLLQQ